MSSEDTDSNGSGSFQDPPQNGSSDEASVLAARRARTARLRGAMAKQAMPPDPYVPDPYLAGSTGAAPSNGSSETADFDSDSEFDDASKSPASNDSDDNVPPLFRETKPVVQPVTPRVTPATSKNTLAKVVAAAVPPPIPQAEPKAEPQAQLQSKPDPAPSAQAQLEWPPAEPAPQPAPQPAPAEPPSNPPPTAQESAPSAQTTQAQSQPPMATKNPTPPAQEETAPAQSAPPPAAVAPPQPDPPMQEQNPPAQAAPLPAPVPAKQQDPPMHEQNPVPQPAPNAAPSTPSPAETEDAAAPPAAVATNVGEQPVAFASPLARVTANLDDASSKGTGYEHVSMPPNMSAPAPGAVAYDVNSSIQAIEVLNNIDQAMGACAMNLSSLQKIASEQTETLRSLAETMQHQSFFEICLNLNSLMESLSGALQPMKSVGELVPAIDQLVSTLEAKEASSKDDILKNMTPDLLVTNLADQLSTGMIDPWTFKCAYMAVYPSDHPADLLHRLVGLLGAQRLSGDLFRSAYDAVQAAEPPSLGGGEGRTIVKVVQDETLAAQIEELRTVNLALTQSQEESAQALAESNRGLEEARKSLEDARREHEHLQKAHSEMLNSGSESVQQLEEYRRRSEELEKRLQQREEEFSEFMASKDHELQEAQELLNSRWEEFNARYDELTETLHKRDELIAEKEAEIARKENEIQLLKGQVDELREQFGEMQKLMAAKPKEEAPAQKPSGFFDPAPQAPNAQPVPNTLFDPTPNTQRPLFQPAAPQMQSPAPGPGPAHGQAQTQGQAPMTVPDQSAQMPSPAAMAPQAVGAGQSVAGAQMAAAQAPAQAGGSSNQAIPRPPATTIAFAQGAGSYGSGVRAQVFEVIVRQALAGAPWREICAGPMSVNNITQDEVEAEVKRRQALLKK